MTTTPRVLRRFRQSGLSLLELMVSLVLGLFLVGVVSMTYIQTASGTRFGALESQMNEDGALALSLLRSQLELAGYSARGANGKRLFRGVSLRGCDGGFTEATEKGAFDNLACNNGNDSAALAVRYQATLQNTQTILPSTGGERPGNCSNVGMTESNVNGVDVFLADNRFYIDADSSNGNAPTLYCRGSDGTGMADASSLVPNVERLRIRYAITRAPESGQVPPHQVTALVNASNALLFNAADWARVAAVELCIVMRTARPVARNGVSDADTAHYLDCDGKADTDSTDGRLRRTYRTLVHLPNLRPGIPSPFKVENGVVANPYAALGDEQGGDPDTAPANVPVKP